MIPQLVRIIAAAAALGTVACLGYYSLCLWSAVQFLRQPKPTGDFRPQPVSILKPLKGTDPEMYESLRSQCVQDYPQYEIVFGVSDAHDPAIALVERLQREFPKLAIQLILCQEKLGTNLKVSNLAQMLKHARFEHLVVADSDIRVAPAYLRQVTAPLADSNVGLVTCLYRGISQPGLGSRLESLGISTDFAGGVLAARQLEGGLHFGFGSTLCFRRGDLEKLGGFEAVVDYLADDYEIGRRISKSGLRVELSANVVETFLPQYTLPEFFRHQLRWARTIRDARRAGYAGLILTFGLPWALLAVLAAGGARWAWELLGLTVVLRIAVALLVGRVVLGDRSVGKWLRLIPLRDFIALAVWITGLAGREVLWRGDRFALVNGKLHRISG